MIDETWFVLYDGSSVDGRGVGHYCGRTTDIEVAKQHYKNCADNPFSTGGVIAYTDTKEVRIYWESDWDKLRLLKTTGISSADMSISQDKWECLLI